MQECKGKVLATQVTNPDLWKSYIVQEVRTLTRRQTKRLNKTRFYAGELRRLHGDEEFEWMVAKGKLIRVEDSDGDECFEKAVRSEIQEVEESRQARSSKSGKITQNSFEDLGEAFSNYYANAKIKKRKTEGNSAIQDSIPEDKHPMKMKKEPKAKIEPTEIQVVVGKARACIPKLVKVQGQLLSVQNGLLGKKLARPIRENVIEILKENRVVCM